MLRKFIKRVFPSISSWRNAFHSIKNQYVYPKRLDLYGECHPTAQLETPFFEISDYSLVFIGPYTKIRKGFSFIGAKGRFFIKKYATVAMNCCVVTDGHAPTLGLPHIITGTHHVNDKITDITIHEAAWIGINCTLLPGAEIGRGAIIGAGSVVNKPIPPYAVAVGCPAKIIATTFTIEQIIEHEKQLYDADERFSEEELTNIFKTYFEGKKSIGRTVIPPDQKAYLEELLSSIRQI